MARLFVALAPDETCSGYCRCAAVRSLGGRREPKLLEPERAFAFSVQAVDESTVEARFAIANGYYLYREKLKFAVEPASLAVHPVLPPGKIKHDEFFGNVETYRGRLTVRLPLEGAKPGGRVTVKAESQGCADAGRLLSAAGPAPYGRAPGPRRWAGEPVECNPGEKILVQLSVLAPPALRPECECLLSWCERRDSSSRRILAWRSWRGGLLALAAGVYFGRGADSGVGRGRPGFAGSVAARHRTGRSRRSRQWKGKVLIVNFWATWCVPCREEMPEFVNLQREYGARGVQFVGIAVESPPKSGISRRSSSSTTRRSSAATGRSSSRSRWAIESAPCRIP